MHTERSTRHSPGPWTIEDGSDIMGCGELLASVYPMKNDGIRNSWKANARLVAAAPDMYEELKESLYARCESCCKGIEHDDLHCGAPNARRILGEIEA